MKSGIELIAEERQRQIEVEGWTPEHDATHDNEEMISAAICYLLRSPDLSISVGTEYAQVEARQVLWPWEITALKLTPDDRIKELKKAAALIVAQIDRLQANP